VLRTTHVIAEGALRVAGYDPGRARMTFGFEELAKKDWYLGFNITRKFWR
jgi:hypothetical protein